ncbi:MAG: PAS domain-containing sensor histidine kinase [Campylobacterota bacterium]|nr:PAS domain-containing sensor histidine kinase [Campylobacterota bacterium]
MLKIKRFLLNQQNKIKIAHFLVLFLLLINIVFFTVNVNSIILQIALIIAILIHHNDHLILDKEVEETEKTLLDQSDRFETAINSSRDGFWDFNIEKQEFYLSLKWKERLGFEKDAKVTYFDYISLISDDYITQHTISIHKIIDCSERTNHQHFRIVYLLITKSGERILIEDVSDAFFDKNNVAIRITGFHRDITEQDRQNKILESQNRVAAIGEMIGNIAHQWRQPIGAINNVLNDLEFDIDLDELEQIDSKEFLAVSKKVKEYTAHMSQTIDDFRTLSSDKKIKTEFLIEDTLTKAFHIIKAEYHKNNIEFILENSDKKHYFNGYERELMQVFINILNNAKDVLMEREIVHPTVEVKVLTENENILITIQDNAGGVLEAIKEKIFDPYFTTKHESVGTGIGLYMSKKIITQHFNSTLMVENEGDGAKFIISLKTEI